jgi:hypothetical protein
MQKPIKRMHVPRHQHTYLAITLSEVDWRKNNQMIVALGFDLLTWERVLSMMFLCAGSLRNFVAVVRDLRLCWFHFVYHANKETGRFVFKMASDWPDRELTG